MRDQEVLLYDDDNKRKESTLDPILGCASLFRSQVFRIRKTD
jgi:hypothetical protein